jgi:hypothetical protein
MMPGPFTVRIGGATINVLATTCPRCGRGTGEFCGHVARLEQALRERLAVAAERRERAKLSELLEDMSRNRAAIAASGEHDMENLAQGAKRMPTWRQAPRHHVRHVSGDHK